jgi:hypothetical protein
LRKPATEERPAAFSKLRTEKQYIAFLTAAVKAAGFDMATIETAAYPQGRSGHPFVAVDFVNFLTKNARPSFSF